jgi:hypothetical protein
MSKILKIGGLLVLIGAFVFAFSGTSSAITSDKPDNETCVISTTLDLFVTVDAKGTCSVMEDEAYTLQRYAGTAANKLNQAVEINYLQDVDATDGITRITKTFDSDTNATETVPNVKVTTLVTFDALSLGLGGNITGEEKIGIRRVQEQTDEVGWCGGRVSVPPACLDVAMGSSYDATYIKIDTNAEAVAVTTQPDDILPSLYYKVRAEGLTEANPYAIGTVRADMQLTTTEYAGSDDDPGAGGDLSTQETYTQSTRASGAVYLEKEMAYRSGISNRLLPGAFQSILK